MWIIPIILLIISSFIFIYSKPLSVKLTRFNGVFSSTNNQLITEVFACLLFLSALILNIAIWKTESAFILTITLFGPCIFFAIINKADQKI